MDFELEHLSVGLKHGKKEFLEQMIPHLKALI